MSVQAVVLVPCAQHGHGLVHHHDPQLPWARVGQALFHALDLLCGDFTVGVAIPARGVHAHDHELGRHVHGLEIVAERGAVMRIGPHKAGGEVEERDIVIARDGHERRAQPVDECARSAKLAATRALRDVAGEHHEIGPLARGEGHERFHHRRLLGAEVRVGDLQQHAHAPACSESSPSGANGDFSR